MTRKGKKAEVIVAENGKVVEAPEWVPIPSAKAPPAPPGK